MPIKNYTTVVPANKSVFEIQDSLAKHGAKSVLIDYEQGTGRIEAVRFLLTFHEGDIGFRLPIDWRKFKAVLIKQKVPKAQDDEYCYKVAWRNVRDWVLAQMALYETQMVELPQVFLPYAMKGDQTFYEVASNQLLLPSK